MTDITQMVLSPTLLARLRNAAPGVRLAISRFTAWTARGLESGEVDLAVGFIPEMAGGFYEQTILMRDFVCLLSRDHPRGDDTVSIRQFNSEPHVVVQASGSGMRRAEEIMQARKVKRRILLSVPDFAGLDRVLAGSDLLTPCRVPWERYYRREGPSRR